MNLVRFESQAEDLSKARRALMLPHLRGEAESVAEAFRVCSASFHHLNPKDLDDAARGWFTKITEFMDTSGVQDPDRRDKQVVKAEGLSDDQKFELSRVVDELAHWFERRSLEESR